MLEDDFTTACSVLGEQIKKCQSSADNFRYRRRVGSLLNAFELISRNAI